MDHCQDPTYSGNTYTHTNYAETIHRFTVMKQTTVYGKNLEWWEKFRVVTKIGENRKPSTTIYPPIAKLTGSKMLGAIGHVFLRYSQQDFNFL